MPLFKCSGCGCVENTALGEYWSRVCLDTLPPLCSECAFGQWHGKFPKQQVDETKYTVAENGMLQPKEE